MSMIITIRSGCSCSVTITTQQQELHRVIMYEWQQQQQLCKGEEDEERREPHSTGGEKRWREPSDKNESQCHSICQSVPVAQLDNWQQRVRLRWSVREKGKENTKPSYSASLCAQTYPKADLTTTTDHGRDTSRKRMEQERRGVRPADKKNWDNDQHTLPQFHSFTVSKVCTNMQW